MVAKQQTKVDNNSQANNAAPVIPLPTGKILGSAQSAVKNKPSWLRMNALWLSLFFFVILPGCLGTFYFTMVASDRYAASAGFAVRSMDGTATGTDFSGFLSGLSSVGTTTTDSYIILEFLQSRELVEKLMKDADFINAYSTDKADFLYKLDVNQPMEDIVDYWQWMINASYDNASELIEFEVQAFTSADAEKIASLITKYAQELINTLSIQARNDAVGFAKKEVSTAELRLKLVREELRKFRSTTNSVDPSAAAGALLQLTTQIEAQIISQRARLNTLRQSVSESSLSVRETKQQIESLEKELAAKKAEISNQSNNANLAAQLSSYERLQVEQEFAQQAYAVSLSSLERSRAEADRQQRFLAVYKRPNVPDSAIYPHRYLNSFLVFVVAFLVWGIGVLLFYSVRDHLR